MKNEKIMKEKNKKIENYENFFKKLKNEKIEI